MGLLVSEKNVPKINIMGIWLRNLPLNYEISLRIGLLGQIIRVENKKLTKKYSLLMETIKKLNSRLD